MEPQKQKKEGMTVEIWIPPLLSPFSFPSLFWLTWKALNEQSAVIYHMGRLASLVLLFLRGLSITVGLILASWFVWSQCTELRCVLCCLASMNGRDLGVTRIMAASRNPELLFRSWGQRDVTVTLVVWASNQSQEWGLLEIITAGVAPEEYWLPHTRKKNTYSHWMASYGMYNGRFYWLQCSRLLADQQFIACLSIRAPPSFRWSTIQWTDKLPGRPILMCCGENWFGLTM